LFPVCTEFAFNRKVAQADITLSKTVGCAKIWNWTVEFRTLQNQLDEVRLEYFNVLQRRSRCGGNLVGVDGKPKK